MSKPIFSKTAETWNKRVFERMRELFGTQQNFISKYKEKFHSGSQSDVSNWIHVGEKYTKADKKDKYRNFPEFETMKQIAKILNVSVSYLIGETDSYSYDEEKSAEYVGLSPSAVRSIHKITNGEVIPPFYKYSDPEINTILELLIKSPSFTKFLKKIYEFVEIKKRPKDSSYHLNETLKKIPEAYREKAFSLFEDAENAIDNLGIVPDEHLRAYSNFIEDAVIEDNIQLDTNNNEVDALQFSLQVIHTQIINEILSSERIDSLLQYYSSR